jgi:hypothetical protein
MVFLRYIFILFFCAIVTNTRAQDDIQNWIISRTEMYSPISAALFKSYSKLPSNLYIKQGNSSISSSKSTEVYEFLELDSKESALTSMSTNVHEIGHAYGGLLHFEDLMNCNCDKKVDFSNINQGFYQGPQEKFWIEIDKRYIYPSRQLVSTIPSNTITFRFKTYINGTSSTQEYGVIGLLDEMNSYYLGSRYKYDMLPVYKELYPADYLNKWVSSSQSSMTAFFEFDFFIKEYLLYAKRYRPDTYKYLYNNNDFRNTYIKIVAKFSALKTQYEMRVNKEKAYMPLYYDSAFWEEDYDRLVQRLNSGVYSDIESDFLR